MRTLLGKQSLFNWENQVIHSVLSLVNAMDTFTICRWGYLQIFKKVKVNVKLLGVVKNHAH